MEKFEQEGTEATEREERRTLNIQHRTLNLEWLKERDFSRGDAGGAEKVNKDLWNRDFTADFADGTDVALTWEYKKGANIRSQRTKVFPDGSFQTGLCSGRLAEGAFRDERFNPRSCEGMDQILPRRHGARS